MSLAAVPKPAEVPTSSGVRIAGPDGPISLKWHRLRRTAGDVDFTVARLREGLAAAASVEVDLRRHGEGSFVCLHDAVLESETDGEGAIAGASVAALRRLRMRGPDGDVSDQPLLLFDDLVDIARHGHPDAIVQFDLKEYRADLDEAIVASFARRVAANAGRFVLSGDDWNAVRAIGERVPDLKLGFDPSDLPEARRLRSAEDFAGFTRFTLDTAPEAGIIYLEYRLVLGALDAGYDMVAALHAGGKTVDAWTFDVTSPDRYRDLARLIASGIDQLSSNDCVAVEDAWKRLNFGTSRSPAVPPVARSLH